jgi:hypothetical protein
VADTIQRWEYRSEAMLDELVDGPRVWTEPTVDVARLDLYGNEGWELVTIVTLPDCCLAVFKRPIVTPRGGSRG